MTTRFAFLAALLMLTSGCATIVQIEPIRQPEQTLVYVQGNGYLTSERPRSVVEIVADEAQYFQGMRVTYYVRMVNRDDAPIDVSEANITAGVDNIGIRIVPSATLVKEEEIRVHWEKVSLELAGAIAQIDAEASGYTYQSGTMSMSSSGSAGYSSASGSYSGYEYDEAKVRDAKQQIGRQTASNIDKAAKESNARMEHISLSALQRTTLYPGDEVYGFIVMEMPPKLPATRMVQVQVAIGDDIHRFAFRETVLE